jgi:tuberous sclerosis 2
MDVLHSVWLFVKDISVYRRPLAKLVFDVWKDQYTDLKDDQSAIIIWRVLGDEIVLSNLEDVDSAAETREQPNKNLENLGPAETDMIADEIIKFLTEVALESQEDDCEIASPPVPVSAPSSQQLSGSPMLSRMHSDFPTASKEPAIPSVMSLLTSFTSGHAPRSQSQPPPVDPVHSSETSIVTSEHSSIPKAVGAVVAMVSAFSELAFASFAMFEGHLDLAERLFKTLVTLLGARVCSRVKIVVLQFCMRLRADRDHRLYYASQDFDQDGLIASLSSLIGRGPRTEKSGSALDDRPMDDYELRRARARMPQPERIGRRLSRGRGGQPSASESSRSRSRAASRIVPPTAVLKRLKPREPLWSYPESVPFLVPAEADTPSSRVASYDPDHPTDSGRRVLPLSSFLTQIVDLIKNTRDWDVLSYILCHLPTQLSNKHLFCGPRSALVINNLLLAICRSILDGQFAHAIERWPEGIIAKDAQGLAEHTLTVLISYKRCFKEIQLRNMLIEAFLAGLNTSPSTIKCCLNALSLSAFELQPSMTKYLPRILERLSQIMSNPTMAVHIIDFLAIVGSLPTLYSNFNEDDFRLIFGVALQYLQQHNRPNSHPTISWALSQHLCIMSYYIVYVWFLAVKLPDRPRHIRYITRQLLLANEGRDDVDEPTEVCFDWLARYTYASADPRPANSMLNDIIMHPAAVSAASEPAIAEKTWILGNSVVTIRALMKRGWVEVISRRASGMSKFLCRAENVPMVSLGDVDPDLLAVCASLTMDRTVDELDGDGSDNIVVEVCLATLLVAPPDILGTLQEVCAIAEQEIEVPRPDPITGYVWSRSAPSQRRKEVAVDPSFIALQLSSYPDSRPSTLGRMVVDSSRLPSFFRSIDLTPVIDTHKIGIMYVAPGQSHEDEILGNTHGSPAYTRFLEGLGRLIDLRGQVDVYAGGLDPDEDGEYAYAWWDDIGQILYHTATLMPNSEEGSTNKKRHIGNDFVRIIWNDSGLPYRFDTLSTQFQFVNIVIEPHSRGAIAAFSDNLHENEYFKVTLQRAPGMPDFTPIGEFKLISAAQLPLLVRQLSLLTDWFVMVYQHTVNDTQQLEMITNWRSRLQTIKRFRAQVAVPTVPERVEGIMGQEAFRDFTTSF